MGIHGGMLSMQKNLAFDIGCNIGKYTACLLENGYQKVVAVDPNPSLFRIDHDRVERIFKACSDKVEDIPFYFCNTNTISTAAKSWVTDSRFSTQGYRWVETNVESTTIDKLVKDFGVPDHIKIDVEGYEETALHGMTSKYSPEICFEWAEEEGDSAVRCVEYLKNLGYREFGYIITDSYLVKPDKYFSLKEFKEDFSYDSERKTEWGMVWAR